MYYPVPGYQHMKVLVQPPPAPQRPSPVRRRGVRPSPLVKVALEAAFGMRDSAALKQSLYAPGVRNHISARRRAKTPAGPVQILTCHAREGGEFFGSAQLGTRRYAYVARVVEGRLVSFKVL
ncbi:hypothetical protein [Corynebacterium sp. UBA2622]|uniref:hypothetical protein n=1 Tax=Corynebacterium sp. UBA2622 TaxID=1946393 RepID=UPI0025BB9913|nr:hypothetical protein [Corynebacterium sp. UBA2622]